VRTLLHLVRTLLRLVRTLLRLVRTLLRLVRTLLRLVRTGLRLERILLRLVHCVGEKRYQRIGGPHPETTICSEASSTSFLSSHFKTALPIFNIKGNDFNHSCNQH